MTRWPAAAEVEAASEVEVAGSMEAVSAAAARCMPGVITAVRDAMPWRAADVTRAAQSQVIGAAIIVRVGAAQPLAPLQLEPRRRELMVIITTAIITPAPTTLMVSGPALTSMATDECVGTAAKQKLSSRKSDPGRPNYHP
jgi:hypothetical protein